MTSKRGSGLEKLVNRHSSDAIHDHNDRLHIIHDHVIAIIFISLIFLASVFVFLTSVPSESHATAYAIVEFKAPDFGFLDALGSGLERIRNSSDQPYFMLTMFVAWILVFGLINIALHEKEWKRRKKL